MAHLMGVEIQDDIKDLDSLITRRSMINMLNYFQTSSFCTTNAKETVDSVIDIVKTCDFKKEGF